MTDSESQKLTPRELKTIATAVRTDSRTAYIAQWIIDECDEDHQDIDVRTLGIDDLREMAHTALEAWNEINRPTRTIPLVN